MEALASDEQRPRLWPAPPTLREFKQFFRIVWRDYYCTIDSAFRMGYAWRAFVHNVPEAIDKITFQQEHHFPHGGIVWDFTDPDTDQRVWGIHFGHIHDVTFTQQGKLPGAQLRSLDYVVTELKSLVDALHSY